MPVSNTDQFADLRMRAEQIAQERRLELGELSPDEVENLMHELHVHQIELELQNQELRQAQQDLVVSRRRYADLYHTAPVGYFTLNITSTVIMEVNHTGVVMLDAENGHLVGQPFTDFVMPNAQDSFYLYLRSLAKHSPSVLQSCEIGMTTTQDIEFYANLEGAGVENSASSTDQCRLIVSDITARRQAEEHQRDLVFEKERVKILQRFIGDASHDLKTPLTTMKVSLAVLRKS
ncbi:MAG: hypothetical protein JW892_06985, partial [Anaerolineae bacterium]|nr:hypothetical protein [Anaerolineae bacterium]